MASPERSLSIAMLIAAAGLAIIAVFAFQRRNRPGARGFVLSMAGAALWTLVLSVNIWPVQFLPGFISMTLRNGLILVIVLGWAWLAAEYVKRATIKLRPIPVAILLLIPALTVVITVTNPLHHLAIDPDTPTQVGGGPAIEWGPWHLVFMAYAFTVSLVPAGYLLRDLHTAHGIHRRQLLFLLVGFGIAFLGVNDYLLTGALEGVPQYVRISPFTFLLTGGMWLVALFEHQLFGLVPVSRRTVVETMPDPVIAVDETGKVVDLNPAASELFDVSVETTGIGFEELCSSVPALREAYAQRTAQTEISIETNGTERHFLVHVEPIHDSHEEDVIILREVTDQKVYEQELERQRDNLQILNQVVRHDIRNDLAVVRGHTELLADKVGEESEEHIEPIQRSVEHAKEFTETARDLSEVMLQSEVEEMKMPLQQEITRQVTQIQSAYPEASVTLEESIPDVEVVADEMLAEVFRNLLQNAIQHNDKAQPEVTVQAEEDTESQTVTISVADNGPGIADETKAEVFEEGTKRLDSSGSGLGLYLVHEIVENYGGEVSVRDNEPEGTIFRVTLPLA